MPELDTDQAGSYRELDSILAEHAGERGERVYVEDVGSDVRLTFAELDALTVRLGHFLAERGIATGDRVTVLSENCWELVVLFFGIQRYGATVNPLNVEVHAKNVAQMLRDVSPRLVFWQRGIPPELAAVARDSGAEVLAFDELFAALDRYPSRRPERRTGRPDDIGILDYTSGTTATPKGVCISHAAAFYMGRSLVERLGITEADRILEYRALSWASPQCLALGPTIQTGATLVLAPRFSRRRFFDWIRDHRVTIAAGVPTVVQMLLEQPLPITATEVPALRFLTSSAAPLAAATERDFERRYGIPIAQGCGMTEAGFMGMNPPDARRAGSIGPVVPYLDARFVDEAGRLCPPGVGGELVVGGRQMASAYLADGGALEPIPQAAFPTGDVGHADADGYLYLTGRKKDVIIRGGVNIAPMEITSVLLAHPAVAEAATIGIPDPLYGEAIVSFVVPRPGRPVTAEELGAHCRTRLSEFKLPKRIALLDALPRTDRGKLARDELRALGTAMAAGSAR
ncbi:MAG TPA: AMP-binding protein [Methylomirabilota bacterium]|jgi:acyl-coenzyme A synthetase/AMP-(fatty) acid ligase|nr:AMP-binding protein [Methylomirabilota bacterium]